MEFIQQTFNILADLLVVMILLRIVLSWFIRDNSNTFMRLLHDATEPILAPVRRALPRLGMIDLSPIIVFLLIELIRDLVNSLL
ncbi:YggT family protein [Candidatus Peregrinibacteria bacterium]|jgi:YggT family protein|nr:YggT family protein [Candidatus Peregrinibacteria bacterium]MBT4631853.1 YggT family protein [Candidatus Peregrinibacteria bacterium]MBT5516422.1 YggT family protein [Candidatus Peregrinibacteria bacterium]MBT5824226.1 YggT family protein [Candidatus Peregrinibacteria bacterium]